MAPPWRFSTQGVDRRWAGLDRGGAAGPAGADTTRLGHAGGDTTGLGNAGAGTAGLGVDPGLPGAGRAALGVDLRALIDQGLLPVEPLADRTVEVDLLKWRLPGASILAGTFAGVRQTGDPASAGPTGDLFFGINVTGASLAHQRGAEAAISAGDAVVVDLRRGPFVIQRPSRVQFLGIRVAAPEPEQALRVVPSHTPALRLLTGYLRGVLDGPLPEGPRLLDAFALHVNELIALSLEPADPDVAPQPGRAVRLAAIKVDIDRHLTDPGLSATAVAARHGISPRYLHKLFAPEPQTYTQYVRDRRLDLAHCRLRDPRYAGRTVSFIAHESGFADLSYFNRAFRRRFGVSPSEVRA